MKITIEVPFVCPDSIRPHLESVFSGEYEVPLYGLTNPVILDIGANVGAFAIWAHHRWPGSIIHAYEPSPTNFIYLMGNTERLQGIHVYEQGIGVPGFRVLFNGRNNCGENSLFAPHDGMTDIGIHVEVKDPLSLPEANMLKVDTEGCELEILEPLIGAGRKFDAIMLEYHRIKDRLLIDALLADYDYTLVGAHIYSPGRGVVRYLNKKHIED